MNTDVKIFISSCLIVLNAYHFIRLCISYFKDKKKILIGLRDYAIVYNSRIM